MGFIPGWHGKPYEGVKMVIICYCFLLLSHRFHIEALGRLWPYAVSGSPWLNPGCTVTSPPGLSKIHRVLAETSYVHGEGSRTCENEGINVCVCPPWHGLYPSVSLLGAALVQLRLVFESIPFFLFLYVQRSFLYLLLDHSAFPLILPWSFMRFRFGQGVVHSA